MHIVAGRQFRHRRFLAKRLQRDLRLQLSRITPSLPWHARLLLLGLDPTLTTCPNFGVHLWQMSFIVRAEAFITQNIGIYAGYRTYELDFEDESVGVAVDLLWNGFVVGGAVRF